MYLFIMIKRLLYFNYVQNDVSLIKILFVIFGSEFNPFVCNDVDLHGAVLKMLRERRFSVRLSITY